MFSFEPMWFRVALRFLEVVVLKHHLHFMLWGYPLFGYSECNEVMIIGS